MIITTKSNGVEITFDRLDSDETKEIVHCLLQLIKLMVALEKRTLEEDK